MSEELKAIFRRLNDEAWNDGKFDLIDDLVSRDLVLHLPDGTKYSFEEYKNEAVSGSAVWSDSHFTIDHMIAEGDMLAAHWTYRATHTGHIPDLDLAPTGKEVTVTGMGFYRFEGGKIVEMWRINDVLGWFQQLGVIPSLGEGVG